MFCRHCGKEMPDSAAFCNGCGNRLRDAPLPEPEPEEKITPQAENEAEQSAPLPPVATTAAEEPPAFAQALGDAASSFRKSDFMEKVFRFLDTAGAAKLCCQLSAAFLAFLLSVRLLGRPFTTILVTAVNAFLLYYSYKKEKKIDWKMMVWSAAAFLIGILISFYIL